jgi:molybdenum cofactor guanylyltransferase
MPSVQPHQRPDVAIVILAGGRATRFPRKLETAISGEPMLARVYRQFRETGPVVIAGRGTFSPALDELLECPIVIDRWPDRGPLGGLLSAALHSNAARIFAVAGDEPLVSPGVLETLLERWEPGDEAIVPEHDGCLEPLAALYDRDALIREASACLRGPKASMHALLARLHARRVSMPAKFFVNVNTADDVLAVEEVR